MTPGPVRAASGAAEARLVTRDLPPFLCDDRHMLRRRTIDDLLAEAQSALDRVEARDLAAEMATGAVVIDIRPDAQRRRDGGIEGAVVVDRNVLEWRLDPTSAHRIPEATDHDVRFVLVCNEGYASSLAAVTLRDIGLHRATDLVGGVQALRAITGGGGHRRPGSP